MNAEASTGRLTGYAYSPNVGWISSSAVKGSSLAIADSDLDRINGAVVDGCDGRTLNTSTISSAYGMCPYPCLGFADKKDTAPTKE